MNVRHRGAWLLVAAVLLAGCTPPWSTFEATDPLAIRATSSGEIEALLIPCSSVRISRLKVTAVADTSPDTLSRVWQVDFSPPATDLHQVVLGQLPPGGTEEVQWPLTGLGSQNNAYVVQVELASGDYWIQGFRRHDLTEGQILFHNKFISPESFAEQSRCP